MDLYGSLVGQIQRIFACSLKEKGMSWLSLEQINLKLCLGKTVLKGICLLLYSSVTIPHCIPESLLGCSSGSLGIWHHFRLGEETFNFSKTQ